ncbi:L-idonate 5-dehydrogenase [Alphaproteobacteria bacterium]|nr:L-idonate 5-dehydrogenase [Alphaproteobacteria bacterium]
MKAIVIHGPKDLRIEEQEPTFLSQGEVEIELKAGGICGSDLHYFNNGGFGAIRLREPMILGHEVSGVVVQASTQSQLQTGDLVAVSPSRPCFDCDYCNKEHFNHCLNMRFYGSAMPMPHIQGAFSERLVVHDWQCNKMAEGISAHEAAFAEPFAVTLHGAKRAGDLRGKRVLVMGCGPIGALTVIAAKAKGAAEIVAVDILDSVLGKAREIGADKAINSLTSKDKLGTYKKDKGYFDVMFEATGNEQALRSGLEMIRPRGTLVQLGLGGDISIPQNVIVAKEIEIRGSFRFHEEFAEAVELINTRVVDLMPLLTRTFPLEEAVEAFETASDKSKSMKVQIAFNT